jgi:hypothetical protein
MKFLGFKRVGLLAFEGHDCTFGLDVFGRGMDVAFFVKGWGFNLGLQFGRPKE